MLRDELAMIGAVLRQMIFGNTIRRSTVRALKRQSRIVDWRHVRTALLSDPNVALLIQVHPSMIGPGCLCDRRDCELLPRYDDYLSRRGDFLISNEMEFLCEEMERVSHQCGRTGKLLARVPRDVLQDAPDLPADRIRATYYDVDWQVDS